MARPLRIEFSGALYHLTARGNSHQDIFNQNGGTPEENIARHISTDAGLAKYHFNELLEKDLISYPSFSPGDPGTRGTGIFRHSISG